MQITKREFLKRLGLLGAAGATGAALGDEYVATAQTLPPGSVGDPDNVWFGQRIFPIPHTVEDGPSSFLKDGKVVMPAREIPVFHETDVVVVGGGAAGFAAAVAAARAGARVALVEKDGSLGGLFTNGMVLVMLATCRREENAKWTLVTRGLCGEFMARAQALGPKSGDPAPSLRNDWHVQPHVDPEASKYLMDTMVAEAKVEMFFHAYGIDVIQDGPVVRGVVFHSKQGPQAILAKQVVDATGDADMAFAAGADYRQITHGIGFITRFANIDRITAKARPANPGLGPDGLPKWWPLAGSGNRFNRATAWQGWLGPKGDGLSVRDVSKAEVLHRKYWWEHCVEMQKTPGWEDVFIANTCSQIGPRATRLVETAFVTTRASVRAGTDYPDVVGWFGQDGKHAAMPVCYRQLVPTRGENVLCAGRMLGAPDTVDTFRLICPCFVTGQAAGVAAALAAQKGIAPRALAASDVRRTLERQGVYLG